MIYQYPGVAMVVRIDAPQTAFHVEIFGADQALLLSSSLPGGRLGPLYQYVSATDSARQLMIKVVPDSPFPRSEIRLELIQLSNTDPNDRVLSQAYRYLSSGLQTEHNLDSSTWAMKSYSLRNAASVFGQLGWEEMQLWSEFFSAHLVLHRLNDELTTLESTRRIQQQAQRMGREEIRLAALVLESEALIRSAEVSGGDSKSARYQSALDVLTEVAQLSGQQGMEGERARATFSRGLIYEALGLPEMSVDQYRQALDIAVAANNLEMANTIRGTAAEAYELIGSTAGALGMLEEIRGDSAEDNDLELAGSLYEKGRLLNQDFRFVEATNVLAEALDVLRGDGSSTLWLKTALEQAWALYSLGYDSQSASLLERALPRASASGLEEQVARGWGSLANMDRANHDYGLMGQHREEQNAGLSGDGEKALYFLARAEDAWVRDGSVGNEAAAWLSRAGRAAGLARNPVLSQRIKLNGCLMAANEPAFTCSPDQAKRLAQDLKSAGVPALRAEAGWILGRILERAGRVKEAQAELESLIADIGLFREVLPGVLGAWYWENRAAIARQYLDVMLQRSGVKTQTYVDGSAVLAAFEWVRMLGSSQSPGYALESLSATSLDRNSLRTLISRLPNGHSESLAAQINRELAGLRSATVASRPDQPASARQVEGWLNGLGRDEVLLSYYFSEPNVYALIADSGQVRLTRLAQGQRIARQLSALRDEIQSGGQNGLAYLDTLGELMLKPVQGVLTSTVFLLSTGPLHGVPLDALRTDAAFFAANHRVVNVLSMETASRGLPSVNRDYEQRVFLAGRPRDSHRLFEYDVQVAPEIARLTDRFVGPGLHIVQGVALHSDEFLDENFASASLIHLASPGTIDLRFPEQSRLRLSGTEDNPGKGLIYPSDIRAFPQSADLVTLSSIAARGENPSGFDSRVGLVSDFLEGGANAVLTSLWLQPQDVVTEFMDDFYERLSLDPQVLDSLVAVRRERLKSVTPEQFVSWAGFQLYIR